MKFHHIGIATQSIEAGLTTLRSIFDVTEVKGPVFDPGQDATVCLAITGEGADLELVEGKRVAGVLRRGIQYYHTCFAVPDLAREMDRLTGSGAILVSPPKPAPLFDGAPVAFVLTKLGLIELLEMQGYEGHPQQR